LGITTERQPAAVIFSVAASGKANLSTGAYQVTGIDAGSEFNIVGQLPSASDTAGTFSVGLFGTIYEGALLAGTPSPPPPTRTPTPTPGCDSSNLQMSFSGVAGAFNGIASNFVVTRMNTAIEQVAPDYIHGLHEVYNSLFNGTDCTQPRNIQISLFEALGGLAAGQSFPVSQGGGAGPGAIIYYGQETSGGESVWSSSAGTVFIDAVNGSVVSLRVVGAAMTETAGAAAGSFTLDVSGQVNNFARQ
jgi:hypothetical protein